LEDADVERVWSDDALEDGLHPENHAPGPLAGRFQLLGWSAEKSSRLLKDCGDVEVLRDIGQVCDGEGQMWRRKWTRKRAMCDMKVMRNRLEMNGNEIGSTYPTGKFHTPTRKSPMRSRTPSPTGPTRHLEWPDWLPEPATLPG